MEYISWEDKENTILSDDFSLDLRRERKERERESKPKKEI